jgi:AraC family transcriptional regulator
MGTPRFRTADHGGFQLTDAWFPPGLMLAPHEHERTVMAVTLQGEWDSVMQRRPYACTAATVLIEPAGERHANHFAGGTHVLILQPEAARCDGLGAGGRLLHRAARFRSDAIAALARRMQWELGAADAAAALCLEGLSLEIVATACRVGEPRRRGDAPPGWLPRAVEYLHAHRMDRVTVSSVAAALDVHPAQLARAFRRHHRMSIGSYVRGLRLHWAIAQLTGSTSPIADIAIAAGFADQSHFTRLCARHTGRTPAQLRRGT